MAFRRLMAVCVVLIWFGVASLPAQAGFFSVTNLVTDDQLANPAQITDPTLVNAWGISRSGTSPFWVSDNGTGKATLYRVDPVSNATVKQGITVTIPGDGTVTGQVFNSVGAGQFNGDNFLFVSEDGTVSGWRGALGTTAETLAIGSAANVYKGSAYAAINGNAYLYGANFKAGTIDVYKGDAGAPNLTGSFTDPNLPSGFAPFNIQNLAGKLYVTYAVQSADKTEDVAGAGNGIVDAFDLQGNLLQRVATGGTLNSPWGLAIAPSSFDSLAGDLLVGNFGDGRISAYDLANGNAFEGQLLRNVGQTLEIDGLWGLIVGGDTAANGSSQRLYFSAGPDNESHGLFGVIASPEPSSLILGVLGTVSLAFCGAFRRWRARVIAAR